MVSLADVAVITKIDLVTSREGNIYPENKGAYIPKIVLMETNALQGNSLNRLYELIKILQK